MPTEDPGAPPPQQGKQVAQKKLERFVKAFEESSDSVVGLRESLETLAGVIDDKDDGLITVIINMTEAIQGLREDLRAAAKAGGLGGLFDILRRGG